MTPITVLKFGGTSVSSQERWDTIVRIAQKRIAEGLKPFIVCSAFSGVSDSLARLIDESKKGSSENSLNAIKEQHELLAKDLGVNAAKLEDYFTELSLLCKGIELTGEASSRLVAKIMSFGELMSTALGAEYLCAKGLNTQLIDARTFLHSETVLNNTEDKKFLSASCAFGSDEKLKSFLHTQNVAAFLTQGFIASDHEGQTVLLGRGGSDTSAAYFAAKLSAVRCEIWTDIPGMYTANPHHVQHARLIKKLDYTEAQEIASAGAKILHPRCLGPLKVAKIPLHISSTLNPNLEGTVVSDEIYETGINVKAIVSKKGITLISLETIDMWRQVGFLAQVFECFKKHVLSVDLVSTSETNVTVTLDRAANLITQERLDCLSVDLKQFCEVRIIDSCGMISIVGRNIRTVLAQMAPAFEVFSEHKIYLMSQAANDLNLTFVVDEDQADRLVGKLHGELFSQHGNKQLFGDSWKETFNKHDEMGRNIHHTWWNKKRDALIALGEQATPLYVYDEETIENKIAGLKGLKGADRLFYSIKANANVQVLQKVESLQMGFECVSQGEIKKILSIFPKIDRKRIIFTPNFVGQEEYAFALNEGILVTLDNIDPLENWKNLFRGKDIFLRIDPGHGKGHHKYVHTAGIKSKFGILPSEIERLKTAVNSCGARVIGLHAHVGSNIFETETWSENAVFLAEFAKHFPQVKILDLGGGLGVAERFGTIPLDLNLVDAKLCAFKKDHPQFDLWIEPGRYVVAEAGVLLATVTQKKKKEDYDYVGINAGMNVLIRPALYGAHHEIVNLSKLDSTEHVVATIVGPICESGDVLGYERKIATPSEGDIILIDTAGAYGRVMSSDYNQRGLCAEMFLEKK